MAGAVARYVKSLWSTREGAIDIITISALPVLGFIYVQQEKQLALIREHRMQFEQLARGMMRVSEQ